MKRSAMQRRTPLLRVSKFLRGGAPALAPMTDTQDAGAQVDEPAFPKPSPRVKVRAGLRRGGRIQARAPRRRERDRIFDPYVAWLHRRACVACGTHTNIQGSHVGSGGMGQKRGGAEDMVPMCGPRAAGVVDGCHAEWGGSYGRFAKKTRSWRMVAAWGWRRDCWRGFLKWVRIEMGKPDYDRDDIEVFEVCEAAITVALARLAPAPAEEA